MDKQQAADLIRRLAEERAGSGFNITFYNSLSPIAFSYRNWLAFSSTFVFLHGADDVAKVALHEIAHAVHAANQFKSGVPLGDHHSRDWRAIADRIGAETDAGIAYDSAFLSMAAAWDRDQRKAQAGRRYLENLVKDLNARTEAGEHGVTDIPGYLLGPRVSEPDTPKTEERDSGTELRLSIKETPQGTKYELRSGGKTELLPEDRSKWPEKVRRAMEQFDKIDKERTVNGHLTGYADVKPTLRY